MAEAKPPIDFSNFSDIKSEFGKQGKKYNHRLPTEASPLVKANKYDAYYKPFDTFNHVTSYKSAQNILGENNLVHNKVADNSIVNHAEYSHPLKSKKVMWFGPGCHFDTSDVKKYGNVKFGMTSIEDEGGMIYEGVNYYFVEVIDYCAQSACRILVTPYKYPALRVYDPYTKGGPWYIDENRHHSHLTKILIGGKKHQENTLEIMREEYISPVLIKNLAVSYVKCVKPRTGVDVCNIGCLIEEPLQRLVEKSVCTWRG